MTNADKIRSMTDEEMAEFFYSIDHYCTGGKCIVVFDNIRLNDSKETILEWLGSRWKNG